MSAASMAGAEVIPGPVLAWVRAHTGAEIASLQTRAGGGASREGAQLTLRFADGSEKACYLTYDLRPDSASERLAGFRAEASALTALQGIVKVPDMLGYSVELRAMLTAMVPGEARFDVLGDPQLRSQVAADFMRQLARLHTLDAGQLALQGFAPIAPVASYLRARIAALGAKHAQGEEDPLLVFGLRWLGDHMPPDPVRTVLIHGDAGPANFLHHDGHVTALLDWEMTHFGDPMEDLAWIAIRDLFQPFVALPECFAAYEQASGIPVDLQRIRYHRSYALMNLVVDSHADIKQSRAPFPGILGNYLVFYTLHLRVLLEGIAEHGGVALPKIALPACGEGPNQRSFQIALDELRHQIVPHIGEDYAAHRAKSLARVIKYWQALDRYGAAFAAMELSELNNALGQTFTDVAHGRQALVRAVRARSLPDAAVVTLLHQRMQRETAILSSAMGALASRSFAPLG
jgi:aminoglycoside phosphotransferase (APT) family kinase protein